MVSNEVVMQTVRRMISSGVDDNTIRITLRGINITDAEIDSILVQAKSAAGDGAAKVSQEPASEENGGMNKDEAESEEGEEENNDDVFGSDVKDEIESSNDEQLANHATTHTVLESQNIKMDEMHGDIFRLHEKMDSPQYAASDITARIKAIDFRISSLEKEIVETKANTIALQDILKKILETDRRTLSELQKGK